MPPLLSRYYDDSYPPPDAPPLHTFDLAPSRQADNAMSHPQGVTVALRQLASHGNRTSRRIALVPDTPVAVGRASRSEVKNLSAADDNALFDCPVISRKHAELELKINNWTEQKQQVMVKDTFSMHGTSVNGSKLMPGKPFQLRVGDTIRLGDSVHRADSNYDGIVLVLDAITTAATHSSTQVKSSQPGISCPSGSESEYDEDDLGSIHAEEERESSAHTTPEQAVNKQNAQSEGGPTLSFPDAITLEDEADEPATSAPRHKLSHSIAIPDTYDELVTELKSAVHANVSQSPLAQGAFQAESDNEDYLSDRHLGDAWSNESDYGEHLYSDDDDVASQAMDARSSLGDSSHYVDQEDQDEDEGPEVMSSKRDPSKELGSLDDAQNQAAHDDTNIHAKSHYDPVRGFQVPTKHTDTGISGTSLKTSTLTSRPSRWDIGPDGASTYDSTGGPVTRGVSNTTHNNNYHDSTSWSAPMAYDSTYQGWPSLQWHSALPNDSLLSSFYTAPDSIGPTRTALPAPALSGPLSSTIPPSSAIADAASSRPSLASASSHALGLKRKASQISIAGEPSAPAEPLQDVPVEDAMSKNARDKDVATKPPVVPDGGRVLKKRKIKQPQTKKSILMSAATEAGKYAAGALVGGVGLVALLASPLGARLAEC